MEEKRGASQQEVRGNQNATSMYGDASVHIHPLPVSSVLPERVWMVPYRQNAFFTGREHLLTDLHTRFMTDRTTVLARGQVINGLGGIGKTQIAVEYAYRHRDQYRFVLWVNAATQETLIAGVAAIADRLQLPERALQEQEKIVVAVLHWLATHEGWLFIVDNADDLDSAVDFLPTGNSGHLLLTTRQQAIGDMEPFSVQQMDQQEGTLLLLRRANLLKPGDVLPQASAEQRQVAEQIVQEMAGLPLALDQAGAYIQETGSGLSDYLAHFRSQRAYLLKRRGRNSSQYPASVATTWSLSFERVEQQLPVASDVLRLCAFLSADAIPEEIITVGEVISLFQELATNALLLDEVIGVLSSYSLLRRDWQERTLSIHRLVQAVLQDAMRKEEAREWAELAIYMTNMTFPNMDKVQWSRCERVLPHALACATWIHEMQIVFPEAASLLNRTGHYLSGRARYAEAELLLKRALEIYERVLGPEHPETATGLNNLAFLYATQGKYAEAEPLYQRALTIVERELGAMHPNTAACLSNLALLYRAQGKYAEAELLLKRVLVTWERELGATHPDMALGLNNLAELYTTQGKYAEAEPLYQRALTIVERELGATHPDTATSLDNLAGLYYDLGKYKEAELLYVRVLAISEQQLGSEHPDTATRLNDLALLYYRQRKYEQAGPLWERALAIREQFLGVEHLHTALSLHNLATFYRDQGKHEQAELLFQRALAIKERQLGPEHLDTVQSQNNLAVLYRDQGKYERAELLFQHVLLIREKELGISHLTTQTTRKDYAILLRTMGRDAEAEQLETGP